MSGGLNSPTEEGEITDDYYNNNAEIADTSRDNYDQASMDLETDSESTAKDGQNTTFDDADALRQLLLSQVNRKKSTSTAETERVRSSHISEGRRGYQRRSLEINNSSRTTRRTALNGSPRTHESLDVTRDRRCREMYILQRKLRKTHNRLTTARDRRKSLLKSLNDCEASIVDCETEIYQISTSILDTFKDQLDKPSSSQDMDNYNQESGSPVKLSRFTHMLAAEKSERLIQPVQDESRKGNKSSRHTAKPINQLSPLQSATSAAKSLLAKQKNELLMQQLRELELEAAQAKQTRGQDNSLTTFDKPVSAYGTTINSDKAGVVMNTEVNNEELEINNEIEMDPDEPMGLVFAEDDEPIDVSELIIREEENFYDDDSLPASAVFASSVSPTSNNEQPTACGLEESTLEEGELASGDDTPLENIPDTTVVATTSSTVTRNGEQREQEILFRIIQRRAQFVEEEECEEGNLKILTDFDSDIEIVEVKSPAGISSERLTRDRQVITSASFGVTSTATVGEKVKGDSPDSNFDDVQILQFKKSISMAKQTTTVTKNNSTTLKQPLKADSPSPLVAADAARRTTKLRRAEKDLQSPLIHIHSYRLNQNFPFHLIGHPAVSNRIDPSMPLCTYELTGRCADARCPWQHEAKYKMTDVDIICDMLQIKSLCPNDITPEIYAKLLLEKYSVEDVSRFITNKIPGELRRNGSSWVYFPSSNERAKSSANSTVSVEGAIEYNSILPNVLTSDKKAPVKRFED